MNEFTGNEREASMLEIIDLLHQYAWSLDGGDGAGLKDVFNESATALSLIHI